ncbi:hypothetical protein OC834_000006 [Tilletia horrida]|nr:hypothetical protein OC834_000006 [Tilletia horrida]
MRQSLLSFAPRSQAKAASPAPEAAPAATPAAAEVAVVLPPPSAAPPDQPPAKSKKTKASEALKTAKKRKAPKHAASGSIRAAFAPIVVHEVDEESGDEAASTPAASQKQSEERKSIPVIVIDDDDDIEIVGSSASARPARSSQPSSTSELPSSAGRLTEAKPRSCFQGFPKKPSQLQQQAPWPKAHQAHVQPSDALPELAASSSAPRAATEPTQPRLTSTSPFDFSSALNMRSQKHYKDSLCDRGGAINLATSCATLEAALHALTALAAGHNLEPASTLDASQSALHFAYTRAKQSIEGTSTTSPSAQMWTQRHAPQRAAQVLGAANQKSALFLRNWLHELMLVQPTSVLRPAAAQPIKQGGAASFFQLLGNKRQKLQLQGKGGKKGKGTEARATGQRRVQRKVDKKGEREKKLKAARQARRGWSALDDSDDDIVDFVVADDDEVEFQSEDDVVDWDGSATPSSARTPEPSGAITTDGIRTPDAASSPPISERPFTPDPLSSSPVIAPGRKDAPKQYVNGSLSSTPNGSQSEARSALAPAIQSVNTFEDRLTNCILIDGPSGVGKTAAVYACAAELGYEVFELFPGMGKRTGKEMEAAVGALAANHMVSGGGSGGGAGQRKAAPGNALHAKANNGSKPASFFTARSAGKVDDKDSARAATTNSEPSASQSAKATSSADAIANGHKAASQTTPTKAAVQRSAVASPLRPQGVRQSVILIEEADILYEEDKGFWPALIELIGRSRRPVIITCNDSSAIPRDDLPLQTTLSFTAPSAEEAAVYLRVVALQDRHILSSDDAAAIYQSTRGLLQPTSLSLAGLPCGGPARLAASASLCGAEKTSKDVTKLSPPDLRLALNVLQFWCSPAHHAGADQAQAYALKMVDASTHSEAESLSSPRVEDLGAAGRYLDLLSFADAHLQPSFYDMIEVHEPDAYYPLSAAGVRDEVHFERGHALLKTNRRDEDQVMAEAGVAQAEEIKADLEAMVGSAWSPGPDLDLTREVQDSFGHIIRLAHSERLAVLFGSSEVRSLIVDPLLHRVPSTSLAVDVAPYVRAMILADDIEAERHAEGVRAAKAAAASDGAGGMNPLMQLRLTRNTRNSQQSMLTAYGIFGGEVYPRYLDVSEAVLNAARRSGFPGSVFEDVNDEEGEAEVPSGALAAGHGGPFGNATRRTLDTDQGGAVPEASARSF